MGNLVPIPIPDITSALPYPPDDPDVVRGIAAALVSIASSLGVDVISLQSAAGSLDATWKGADSTAAQREIRTIATYASRCERAMSTANSALNAYAVALDSARRSIDGLRRRYAVHAADIRRTEATGDPVASMLGQAPRTLTDPANARIGLDSSGLRDLSHRQRLDVLGDLDAVAHRAAAAIDATLTDIGIETYRSVAPGAVTSVLAGRLPLWQQRNRIRARQLHVTEMTAKTRIAAHDIGSLIATSSPKDRAEVVARYRRWQRDPAFARAFLTALNPAGFAYVTEQNYPALRDYRTHDHLDSVFSFYGNVLATGTGQPGMTLWTRRLTREMDRQPTRRALGLTLRSGTYSPETLEAMAPAMLRHTEDEGSPHDPWDDPTVGTMLALASQPAVARSVLTRDKVTLPQLLGRDWATDDGQSLGAALSSAAQAPGSSATLAHLTITSVAHGYTHARLGAAQGIADVLATQPRAVQATFAAANSATTTAVPGTPRSTSPYKVDDLSRALYVAFHDDNARTTVLQSQFTLASSQVRTPMATEPERRALLASAVTTGALGAISAKASQHYHNMRTQQNDADARFSALPILAAGWIAGKGVPLACKRIAPVGPPNKLCAAVGVAAVSSGTTGLYDATVGGPAKEYAAHERHDAATTKRRIDAATTTFVTDLGAVAVGLRPAALAATGLQSELIAYRTQGAANVDDRYLKGVDLDDPENIKHLRH